VPETKIVFFREEDGAVPVLEWLLTDVLRRDKKLFAWCYAAIELLGERGLELTRPHAAYLDDGIFELRIKYYRQNYRILYFYHEKTVAVLAHGLVKESAVPQADLGVAARRKAAFEADPERHSYHEDEEDQ
jgi:phage-related protein